MELEKKLQELTAQGIFKSWRDIRGDRREALHRDPRPRKHPLPPRHDSVPRSRDDCKDRLRVFLLPMENQAMDAEMAKLSTRIRHRRAAASGVTTVLDMYYFEEVVAKVMDEMGIRGIAGETVMEKDSCDE